MKKHVSTIVIGLGSLLIFFSWVAQNYFEKKWANDVANQEGIHELISRETYLCDFLGIEYNKLLAAKPHNDALLALVAVKLSVATSNIMDWSDALAAGEAWNFKKTFATYKELTALYTSKRYKEVIAKASQILVKYDREWKPPLVAAPAMSAYLKKRDWNKRFLWLYILGSILISIGWIINKVRSVRCEEVNNKDVQRQAMKAVRECKRK